MAWELTVDLRHLGAHILCCHTYKPNLVGRLAARRAGIPVVAVSRGWTAESTRVRLYEALDRLNLRWMDRVVCVSEEQARKVRRIGVPAGKVTVIRNAVQTERFANACPDARLELGRFFPRPVEFIVGAAGRLSPEKGFDILIEAAEHVLTNKPSVGFVLFGDGPLRAVLARQVKAKGIQDGFTLAGFRDDLDRLVPHLDLFVQSSHTEGLPNVLLEACAVGVPVVATAVGGTGEIIDHDVNGRLVPPRDSRALAVAIREILDCESSRKRMGDSGSRIVRQKFTFEAQSDAYVRLFGDMGVVCRPAVNGTGAGAVTASVKQS
jgi:glycosyltransferase involved in cell wall biosynthesis